jgi:hypothetical protein
MRVHFDGVAGSTPRLTDDGSLTASPLDGCSVRVFLAGDPPDAPRRGVCLGSGYRDPPVQVWARCGVAASAVLYYRRAPLAHGRSPHATDAARLMQDSEVDDVLPPARQAAVAQRKGRNAMSEEAKAIRAWIAGRKASAAGRGHTRLFADHRRLFFRALVAPRGQLLAFSVRLRWRGERDFTADF